MYLSDLNNATGIAVQTVLDMQDGDVLYIGTVVFNGNTFCQDDSLNSGSNFGEDGFALQGCGNNQIEKL